MKTPTDRRKGIYIGKPLKELADVLWWPKDQQSKDIHSNYTVIKLNSTYVETVDDGYPNRGYGAMTGLVFACVSIFLLTLMFDRKVIAYSLVSWVGLVSLLGVFLFVCLKITKHDCFASTHYPIRYNRKNRTVYSWRPDGKALKVKWDELCFFPNRPISAISDRLIVGAVLSSDKKNVEDIFYMGVVAGTSEHSKMYVEFFRRFMDAGAEAVLKHPIAFQLRLDQRKEGFIHGWRQLLLQLNGLIFFQLLNIPVFSIQSLFRWLAMRTSKIPAWPEWVEAECQIEPNDPWIRDINTNP
jgi:hypothetical protein